MIKLPFLTCIRTNFPLPPMRGCLSRGFWSQFLASRPLPGSSSNGLVQPPPPPAWLPLPPPSRGTGARGQDDGDGHLAALREGLPPGPAWAAPALSCWAPTYLVAEAKHQLRARWDAVKPYVRVVKVGTTTQREAQVVSSIGSVLLTRGRFFGSHKIRNPGIHQTYSPDMFLSVSHDFGLIDEEICGKMNFHICNFGQEPSHQLNPANGRPTSREGPPAVTDQEFVLILKWISTDSLRMSLDPKTRHGQPRGTMVTGLPGHQVTRFCRGW